MPEEPAAQQLPWLDPPWEWYHPEPDVPFELKVVRYEVGLADRPIEDPPGHIVRPTIRFHLLGPFPPTGKMYVDFTNQGLLLRVLDVYDDLFHRSRDLALLDRVSLLQRLDREDWRPLTLKLTRHGRRMDTMYGVDVQEDWRW